MPEYNNNNNQNDAMHPMPQQRGEERSTFSGSYSFLSNMYDVPVTYKGITYRNAEAAFQAQKNPKNASAFANLSGADAKELGNNPERTPLRSDWNNVRVSVMTEIERAKYEQHPDLMEKLCQISGSIVEDTAWQNSFWGTTNGQGRNTLGQILMLVRNEHLKETNNPYAGSDMRNGYFRSMADGSVRINNVTSMPVFEQENLNSIDAVIKGFSIENGQRIPNNHMISYNTELAPHMSAAHFFGEYTLNRAIERINSERRKTNELRKNDPDFEPLPYIYTSTARDVIEPKFVNAMRGDITSNGGDAHVIVYKPEEGKNPCHRVETSLREALKDYASADELNSIGIDFVNENANKFFNNYLHMGSPMSEAIAAGTLIPVSPYDSHYGRQKVFLDHGENLILVALNDLSRRLVVNEDVYDERGNIEFKKNTGLSYTSDESTVTPIEQPMHDGHGQFASAGSTLNTFDDIYGISKLMTLGYTDADRKVIRDAFINPANGKPIDNISDCIGIGAGAIENTYKRAMNILDTIKSHGYDYTISSNEPGTIDADITGTGYSVRIVAPTKPVKESEIEGGTSESSNNEVYLVGRVYDRNSNLQYYISKDVIHRTTDAGGHVQDNPYTIPNMELRPLLSVLGQPMLDADGNEIEDGMKTFIKPNGDPISASFYNTTKGSILVSSTADSVGSNGAASLKASQYSIHYSVPRGSSLRYNASVDTTEPLAYIQNAVASSRENFKAQVNLAYITDCAQKYNEAAAENNKDAMQNAEPAYSDNETIAKLQSDYFKLMTGRTETLPHPRVNYSSYVNTKEITGFGEETAVLNGDDQASAADEAGACFNPNIAKTEIVSQHLDEFVDLHIGHFDAEHKVFDMQPYRVASYMTSGKTGEDREHEFSDKLKGAIEELNENGITVDRKQMLHGDFSNKVILDRTAVFDKTTARSMASVAKEDSFVNAAMTAMTETCHANGCGVSNLVIDDQGIVRGTLWIPKRQAMASGRNGSKQYGYTRFQPAANGRLDISHIVQPSKDARDAVNYSIRDAIRNYVQADNILSSHTNWADPNTCTPDQNRVYKCAEAVRDSVSKYVVKAPIEYGQIFRHDTKFCPNPEVNVFVTKYASGENKAVVPGNKGSYMPVKSEDYGDARSLGRRLRVRSLEDEIAAKVSIDFVNGIHTYRASSDAEHPNVFGKVTMANSVYRRVPSRSYNLGENGDYMKEAMTNGNTRDHVALVMLDQSKSIVLNSAYKDNADASAEYEHRLKVENGSGIYNDNYRSYYTDAGNRMVQVIPEELAGYVDQVETATAGNQGSYLYLVQGAEFNRKTHSVTPAYIKNEDGSLKLDANGKPIIDRKAQSDLMASYEGRYQKYNMADRIIMFHSACTNAIGMDEHSGIAMMPLQGWGSNDGIIISKKFAERHILTVTNPATGETSVHPLRAGDKLSDGNGNKGVISLVVDPDADYSATGARRVQPEIVELFKANPGLDLVMQPYSFISRGNGGSMKAGLDAHGELLVPETEINADGTVALKKGADGKPAYKSVKGGLMKDITIYILPQTSDAKNHLENRKISSQRSWTMSAISSPAMAAEFFSSNGKVENLREYLHAIGFDIDARGNAFAGCRLQKGENPNWFHLPENIAEVLPSSPENYKRDGTLNRSVITKAVNNYIDTVFAPAIADHGGYLVLPDSSIAEQLTGYKDRKLTKLSELTGVPAENGKPDPYVLPIMSSHVRVGKEILENVVSAHDFTRRYNDFAKNYITAMIFKSYERADQKQSAVNQSIKAASRSLNDLAYDVIRNKLNATNKKNAIRDGVMSRVNRNGGTMVLTENPTLDMDECGLSLRTAQKFGLVHYDSIEECIKHGEMDKEGHVLTKGVLVHRDPTWRPGAVRYLKVKIDGSLDGISINPIIDKSMDADHDGDTVGNVALHAKDALKEAEKKWTPSSHLLDPSTPTGGTFKDFAHDKYGNKILADKNTPADMVRKDSDGKLYKLKEYREYDLFFELGLDIKSGESANPALKDELDMIRKNINHWENEFALDDNAYEAKVKYTENRIKAASEKVKRVSMQYKKAPANQKAAVKAEFDKAKAEYDKAVSLRDRCTHQYSEKFRAEKRSSMQDSLNSFSHKAFSAAFGIDIIDFESKETMAESLNGIVQDGAKGSPKKLAAALGTVALEAVYDKEQKNIVELKELPEPKMPVTAKDAMFANSCKSFGTPFAGAEEIKAVASLRNLGEKYARAAEEVGYLVSQSVLQVKHDPVQAGILFDNLKGVGRTIWNGFGLKKDPETGRWKEMKSKNGMKTRLNPDEWVSNFMAFYQDEKGMKVTPNEKYVKVIAKGLSYPDSFKVQTYGDSTLRKNLADACKNSNIRYRFCGDEFSVTTTGNSAEDHKILDVMNHAVNTHRIPAMAHENKDKSITVPCYNDRMYTEIMTKCSELNAKVSVSGYGECRQITYMPTGNFNADQQAYNELNSVVSRYPVQVASDIRVQGVMGKGVKERVSALDRAAYGFNYSSAVDDEVSPLIEEKGGSVNLFSGSDAQYKTKVIRENEKKFDAAMQQNRSELINKIEAALGEAQIPREILENSTMDSLSAMYGQIINSEVEDPVKHDSMQMDFLDWQQKAETRLKAVEYTPITSRDCQAPMQTAGTQTAMTDEALGLKKLGMSDAQIDQALSDMGIDDTLIAESMPNTNTYHSGGMQM